MKEWSGQEKLSLCVTALTLKPDFPAFSQHIQKILIAADDEEVSVRKLTRLIIRDYSLTLKLLRRANCFNLSGKRILSVAHAVIMLGIEAVRHLAMSLMIFEHFRNKPGGVRELITLSMLSANHVRDIAARFPSVQPEEAYLCGMVRNLGEVLAAYYLPAEYATILKLIQQRKKPAYAAALEVLGFTFEDLGEAVARFWAMPERAVACQRATAANLSRSTSADNLLMAAVSLGHQITTAAYRMEPEAGARLLKQTLADHQHLLGVEQKDAEELLRNAVSETRESLSEVGVRIDELRLQTQTENVLKSLAEAESREPAREDTGAAGGQETLERLAAEVCSLLDSRVDLDLNTLILMVLEAIYRGCAFDRVVFAFVTQDRSHIEGRIGLGDDVDSLIERFKFRMSASGGPVSVALISRRTAISGDCASGAPQIERLLGCGYLGLYPITVAGQVVGCIYMENRKTRSDITAAQLQLIEELRAALVRAISRFRSRVTQPVPRSA